MSTMRPGVLLCLLVAVFMSGHAWAQESPPRFPPTQGSGQLSFLVRASLARVRVGLFDGELDVLRAGMGLGWGKFGFIVSTGVAEIAPSGWSGDYMLQLTTVPIEGDITYGLAPARRRSQPVFYVHGEYNWHSVAYQLHGGGVSVGALWTFWAVSGGVQASWRRSIFGEDQTGNTYRDFYSAGLTLDLGGWWPIRLRPAED
jgi:hypothetical protein